MNTAALLLAYTLRLLPGLALGGAFLALLPRARVELRLATWVLLFILMRDAMTPLGLWRFGDEGGFWLRMSQDTGLLLCMGGLAAGLVGVMNRMDPALARAVVWRERGWLETLALGVLGALVVALPLWARSRGVPLAERGGPVPTTVLPALLVFCLLGNLYEEVLFRGYLQGVLEPGVGAVRAALLSGVGFALCHVFLASTVTGVGAPLLLFTLWEGTLAGLVRARAGVLASTLLHGGAIFLLASGLAG
jgi:membrane protease YdiL (CAAX protease family)